MKRKEKNRVEFKVNDYLVLKLENNRTNIYVKGRLFNVCKFLLLNIPVERIHEFDDIDSIDEAAENLDTSMEGRGRYQYNLTPETEFWGHCSNLQAWYENGYDTRIIHRNLAFPLLKALYEAGDPQAKKVFKEEIAIRLESGYPSVVIYLINEGYLNFLSQRELEPILDNQNFFKIILKYTYNFNSIPQWLLKKIEKQIPDFKKIVRKKVSMSPFYDVLFKIVIFGDSGTGKNTLMGNSTSFYTEDYKMTIGVDFGIKSLRVDNFRVKLQMWVLGDQERFSSIRPMYYRGSLGAVLVFDLTNYASFKHLPQWIEEVRANIKNEIPFLLVGNKSDLMDQRTITIEEINQFTKAFNLYYMETSAKTGENVEEAFETLTRLMLQT